VKIGHALTKIEGQKCSKHGKSRFWASLEMFQFISDMTPSALGIIMLGIQNMMVAAQMCSWLEACSLASKATSKA
jgi:hypothetical protein